MQSFIKVNRPCVIDPYNLLFKQVLWNLELLLYASSTVIHVLVEMHFYTSPHFPVTYFHRRWKEGAKEL